jgi:hypothetical protein
MLFRKDLIDKILVGTKTMTSRGKRLCKVGDVTNLMANKDYSKVTGKYIKITSVYRKALGEFTDEDARKEGFKNIAEFKEYWKKNIDKGSRWSPGLVVWVHEFVLCRKDS